MKNAVMVYQSNKDGIFNIGDYIQSIAARQFFPKIDTFVNREKLDETLNEGTNLIMNGWFMNNPTHWPPGELINPLFVSFHINKSVEKNLLSPESIKYFKKYEPIGCRDFFTKDILSKHGVESYFSGCLTLTLGETYKRTTVDDTIYITDLNTHFPDTLRFRFNCLKNLLFKNNLMKQIRNRHTKCGISISLRSVVAFYTTFSSILEDSLLLKAVYINQEIKDTFLSDNEKFQYADELLKKYLKARYVITSRIHCALPCLAMGVPVLFVHNENLNEINNCRLDGLAELFKKIIISGNKISCEIGKRLNETTAFTNKARYKYFAEKLTERCREFVSECNEDI